MIACLIFVVTAALQPDIIAKFAYQIKQRVAEGSTGKVYEWVQIELPQPSPLVP